MFSAGSASFLITCTVLSVLLPPTPEHQARPSFGFSPGLGSLHLGHPYKMFCFVHLTLSECHLSLTTRPTVVVDLIFLPFCCFGFAAVIQFGDPYQLDNILDVYLISFTLFDMQFHLCALYCRSHSVKIKVFFSLNIKDHFCPKGVFWDLLLIRNIWETILPISAKQPPSQSVIQV